MRRIYAAFCGVLLAVLLLIGLISAFDKDEWYSDKQQRSLQTKPELTVSGLLDGSYYDSWCSYYADTFPSREDMLDTFEKMEGFYTFSGEGEVETEPETE